jgi:hypothetical protein
MLGFYPVAGGPISSLPATNSAQPAYPLTEDFVGTGGQLDSAKWTFDNQGGLGDYNLASGQLHEFIDGYLGATQPANVISVTAYSFLGTQCHIQCVQMPTRAGNAAGINATFAIAASISPATNFFGITFSSDGTYTLNAVDAGVESYGGAGTWTAANFGWIRLRENSNVVYYDRAPTTAANPPAESDWVNLGSVSTSSVTWDASSTLVSLNSSVDGSIAAPQSEQPVIWDSLNTATASGGSTTLQTTPGAYSLTGSNARAAVSRKLNTTPGAYSLTGSSASLTSSRKLLTSPGSYSLTGSNAKAVVSRKLLTSPGSYSLTGSSASLTSSRKLSTSPGSYSLTGSSAKVSPTKKLNTTPGSYSLTGSTVNVVASRKLATSPGSYAISGSTASVVVTKKLLTSPGSYSLTGSSAQTLATRKLYTSAGSYSLTGSTVRVALTRRLSSTSASYSLTGASANASVTRVINTTPGTYSVVGSQASAFVNHKISVTPGTYSLSGASCTLSSKPLFGDRSRCLHH